MMAKFNPRQNTHNGGTMVMAWGPLFWSTDPDARKVVVNELSVTQNNVTASSAGSDECAVGEANWNLPLVTQQGQKLRSGHARAHGVVTVIDPAGGEPTEWDDDVELH